MAEKPKPKLRPKRKGKFTDKAESERFIKAAQTLGIEEIGPAFDEAFKKIIPAKR